MSRVASEAGRPGRPTPGRKWTSGANKLITSSLRLGASLFVVTLGLATAVAADDSKIIFPGGGTPSAAPAGGGGGMANTITLVMAVLLAAVGGFIFWRNRRSTTEARGGRSLAIDETRSLGNRQYLVVASYEGRKFLLGVVPGRIDMLAPLNDKPQSEDSFR